MPSIQISDSGSGMLGFRLRCRVAGFREDSLCPVSKLIMSQQGPTNSGPAIPERSSEIQRC